MEHPVMIAANPPSKPLQTLVTFQWLERIRLLKRVVRVAVLLASRGHGGSAHGAPLAIVATGFIGAEDLGEGAGIEPVPVEPEKESVKDNEGCAVAVTMVKLADSGAFDEGAA
ncbi:hypothetical protein FH972_019550 [Carpinus fangiana]|uniref:Uncharacterized protein n=1 Tax=Carpinus fangiana TaxID=176857 RepID=A0A5N6RQS4_9ROSI|nr:hypothetical protein FH972_019550 [Carpinus fangiana]